MFLYMRRGSDHPGRMPSAVRCARDIRLEMAVPRFGIEDPGSANAVVCLTGTPAYSGIPDLARRNKRASSPRGVELEFSLDDARRTACPCFLAWDSRVQTTEPAVRCECPGIACGGLDAVALAEVRGADRERPRRGNGITSKDLMTVRPASRSVFLSITGRWTSSACPRRHSLRQGFRGRTRNREPPSQQPRANN